MSLNEKLKDKRMIAFLWSLTLPYTFYLILSVFFLLLGKGILVLIPISIKLGIDRIQNIPLELTFFNYHLQLNQFELIHIFYFMVGVLLIHFIASYLQIIVTNHFSQNIMKDLREKVFSHIIHQSIDFHNKNRVGQLITRVIHDIQTLNELFVSGVASIIGDIFLIICIILASFLLDYRLALVSFVTVPFLYYGMMVFKKYARKSFSEIRVKLARINSFLQSSINGIKLILSFNKQNKFMRQFRKIQKDYLSEYLRTVKIYSLFFPGVELFSIIARLVLLLFGAYLLHDATASEVSNLIAFLLYSQMFFMPLRELSEQYNVLQAALASTEKVFNILDSENSIKDPNNPVPIENILGEIEFKNVSFGYKEDQNVLKNISFKVKAGEKIAIVGLTGSGKTTIINLIARLYDINEGEILIDGVNIKDYNKKELRSFISYVLQDVFIFSDTIKENIRLFNQNITDEEIYEAAQQVQVDQFVNKFDRGYESLLGELGIGISFGEKQLLAFARAFIEKSKIIIFDEATSNIDLKTENIIKQNIKELIKDKTSIIIAHRLSTIKEVDKIIVINKGEIIESGTHTELLKNKGLYEKLYQLQFEMEPVQSHLNIPEVF